MLVHWPGWNHQELSVGYEDGCESFMERLKQIKLLYMVLVFHVRALLIFINLCGTVTPFSSRFHECQCMNDSERIEANPGLSRLGRVQFTCGCGMFPAFTKKVFT